MLLIAPGYAFMKFMGWGAESSLAQEKLVQHRSTASTVKPNPEPRGFWGNLWRGPGDAMAVPGNIAATTKNANVMIDKVNVQTLPQIETTLRNYDKLAADARMNINTAGKTVEQLGKNTEQMTRDISALKGTASRSINIIAAASVVAAGAASIAGISYAISNNKESKKLSSLEKSLADLEKSKTPIPPGPHIAPPIGQ